MIDGEPKREDTPQESGRSPSENDQNISSQSESEIAASIPRLFPIEYSDSTLKDTPEAQTLEDLTEYLSIMKYISAKHAYDTSPLSEKTAQQLGESKRQFTLIENMVSGFFNEEETGVDTHAFESAVSELKTVIRQDDNPPVVEEKVVKIADQESLSASVSPSMFGRLLHDFNNPLTGIIPNLDFAGRGINSHDEAITTMAHESYKDYRTVVEEFPERIDEGAEIISRPFERDDIQPFLIQREFRRALTRQAMTLRDREEILPLTFDQTSLPDDFQIPVAHYLIRAMAENAVSNYVKKIHAEKEKKGEQFEMLHMNVRMGMNDDYFVIHIDDTGDPFDEEDINDEKGFRGMRDRNKHGYKTDNVESRGVGNAFIDDILHEYYQDVDASFRPARVTNPDGKEGARVQFRMKMSQDKQY